MGVELIVGETILYRPKEMILGCVMAMRIAMALYLKKVPLNTKMIEYL